MDRIFRVNFMLRGIVVLSKELNMEHILKRITWNALNKEFPVKDLLENMYYPNSSFGQKTVVFLSPIPR